MVRMLGKDSTRTSSDGQEMATGHMKHFRWHRNTSHLVLQCEVKAFGGRNGLVCGESVDPGVWLWVGDRERLTVMPEMY